MKPITKTHRTLEIIESVRRHVAERAEVAVEGRLERQAEGDAYAFGNGWSADYWQIIQEGRELMAFHKMAVSVDTVQEWAAEGINRAHGSDVPGHHTN